MSSRSSVSQAAFEGEISPSQRPVEFYRFPLRARSLRADVAIAHAKSLPTGFRTGLFDRRVDRGAGGAVR